MKSAINATTWRAYARWTESQFDWKQFVRDAAEAGYEGVELGGTEETLGKPRACRNFVSDQGLEIAAFAANVTYNPWPPNTDAYRASMRYAAELGVSTIMSCGGFLPNPRRTTHAFDYDMFADNLGCAVAFAESLGLTVAFHPHRGCIVETIDEAAEMVTRLPELCFCIDTGHLEACGEDALAFVKAFHDRIAYTHIKDYAWEHDSFIELGHGDGGLDIAACVRELVHGGYEGWLAIELDKKFDKLRSDVRTPLESARMNRHYLVTNGLVQ
jgi:inosose dehydratase